MGRLDDKVALITGAGGGIGRASALLFASEGARIVCADIEGDSCEQSAEMIRSAGGEAVSVRADVSSSEDIAATVTTAMESYGALHVMFNNAGIMHSADGNAQETSEETWDLTMDINAKGVFLGCKHGIPAIKRSGGGSVINTASFVAHMGAATPQVAYTASKGAVLSMTRELAVVHARDGIRINALCPGPLQTELLMKFLDTDEKKHRRLVHVPMGRFGLAEEMAKAALFLASEDASYITGSEFLVDGGITAAYVTPE